MKIDFDREKVKSSIFMRLLEYAAHEDRLIEAVRDVSKLIKSSESTCEKAQAEAAGGSCDYAEAVIDEECESIEALIGVCLITLQVKITRIKAAAHKFYGDNRNVTGVLGHHSGLPYSLVECVNHLANYYKHRDEWKHIPLDERGPTSSKNRQLVTQTAVAALGIEGHGSGPLRTAYIVLASNLTRNVTRLRITFSNGGT